MRGASGTALLLRHIAPAAILVLALVVRAYVIWTQTYLVFPDETFQYLEQAHRLAFGAGVVPWEYFSGLRSWFLPGILAGVMRGVATFSTAPIDYLHLIYLLCALLSLVVVYAAYRMMARRDGHPGAIAAGLICAGWFELVYFAPAVLTEVISAHCAIGAILLADAATPTTPSGRRRLLIAGALYALAFCLRFHYAPAVLAAVLWAHRLHWSHWRWLMLGALPVLILVGGVLDVVTWGLPFQSIWLNFLSNSVGGFAESVSREPWYFFIRNAWWMWQWAAILLPLAVIGVLRLPQVALVASVVLISHSLIGHKEYRHIYLALACVAILVGAGASTIVTFCNTRLRARGAIASTVLLVALGSGLSLHSASTGLQAKRFHQDRAVLLAFLAAHNQPDLCGLGVKGIDWVNTGGYTYLHRQVPIYFADYEARYQQPGTSVLVRTEVVLHGQSVPQVPGLQFARSVGRFNMLIAPVGNAEPNYSAVACFKDDAQEPAAARICLYRRPGTCAESS
jgi:GPI mannosyltransferase 3